MKFRLFLSEEEKKSHATVMILYSYNNYFSVQWCLLTSASGGEQGGRQHVRRQDHRQEGAQGQGGLTRE